MIDYELAKIEETIRHAAFMIASAILSAIGFLTIIYIWTQPLSALGKFGCTIVAAVFNWSLLRPIKARLQAANDKLQRLDYPRAQ